MCSSDLDEEEREVREMERSGKEEVLAAVGSKGPGSFGRYSG